MDSLSRTTWSRTGVVMVLDTAKPKNRKSTKKLGIRGRDAARKLTFKVDILQVFTVGFPEIQFNVNHNSQSDGQNKNAKRWTNFQKKIIRIISPQRNLKDTKDNGISPWTSQAKMGLCDFDPIFELLSLSKNRLHRESGAQVAEPISPEQYRRWHPSSSTSWWDWMELEVSSQEYFKWPSCYSWFRLQLMAIHCNRLGV